MITVNKNENGNYEVVLYKWDEKNFGYVSRLGGKLWEYQIPELIKAVEELPEAKNKELQRSEWICRYNRELLEKKDKTKQACNRYSFGKFAPVKIKNQAGGEMTVIRIIREFEPSQTSDVLRVLKEGYEKGCRDSAADYAADLETGCDEFGNEIKESEVPF